MRRVLAILVGVFCFSPSIFAQPVVFPDNTTSQRFVEVSVTGEPGTLPLLAPEPGTMGMMGAGLLGLAGILRRRLAR